MASRISQLLIDKPQNAAITPTILPSGSRLSLLDSAPEIPEIPKSVKIFPSTMEVLADLQIDPLSLKENPKKVLKTAWDSMKTSVLTGAEQIKQHFRLGEFDLRHPQKLEPRPISKEIGGGLEAISGVAKMGFSPMTAFFEGANKIPVLGSVSKLISLPFIVMGETGTKIGGEIVDKLPISDEKKNDIKRGVEEIFALGAQLAIGKVGSVGTKKTAELVKRFGEKDAQTIVNKANELAKQAQEPVPVEVKPEVIEKTGKVTPQELAQPVIERGRPRKYIEVPREQLPVKMSEAEKGVSVLESRMKGLFETENVKKAKAEAEARGLDISVYDKMNKPEQLRNAAKYVSKTSQNEVLEVLEGKREAPGGLLHNAIMLALEEKSLRDKNVNLAIKLASLRSTRMGQEISILTEVSGLRPEIGAMQEIIRARRSFAEKRLPQGVRLSQKAESMKTEIKIEQTKQQLKMSEVQKILNEITC